MLEYALFHLECSMLGVECKAELYLAAVVSHNEAILPLLEIIESSMTFEAHYYIIMT